MVSKKEVLWIKDSPTDGSNFTNYGTVNTGFPASMHFLGLSFNNASSGANLYLYSDMSSVTDYTIQSGDYLEYDVRFSSYKCGFDYTCTDGTNLRDSGAVDQNGYSVHPNSSISIAGWYHRIIALPAGHTGKTISYYDVA
ncbi:MAG: hypothetical protein WC307_06390, partial [Candidatus Nanoarchaeia archaeon]